VVVILGSTVFDGISRSGWWSNLVAGTPRIQYLALGTAGLAGAVAAVAISFGAAMLVTRRLTNAEVAGAAPLSALFALTLVPLAIGYTIAHYFSSALFQRQQGYVLGTDPLGRGWDLLGLAGSSVNYTLLSTTQMSFVQVGAIVLGHVVAVLSAHNLCA